MPRSFRREIDRIFDDFTSPRTIWAEMDRLLDEFVSPMPLRRRVEQLFEDMGGRRGAALGGAYMPALDLTETEGEYTLRADLPGVREQDLDIRVDDDNVLTVRGERHADESGRQGGYEYHERSHGAFSRSVALPAGIDASKIDAEFRNGVLVVHVAKAEASKPRRIAIRGGEPRVLATGNGPGVQQTMKA